MGAASRHFLTEGYERTSMDTIAAQASVSKQTVYSHFANKDELFRECIINKIELYGLDMQGFESNAPVRDVLKKAGMRFLSLLADDDVIAMHRLLIAETPAFPQLAASFWESGPQTTMQALTELLQQCNAHERCQISDPQKAASDFLLLIEGHYFMRRLINNAEPLSEDECQHKVCDCVEKILRLYDANYQPESGAKH